MRTVRFLNKAKSALSSAVKKFTAKDRAAYTEEKVYCPPEKDISRRSEIFGILFRGAVVFCALFGLIYLIYGSVGIYKGQVLYTDDSFSLTYMLGISFLFSAIAALTPVNRVTMAVLPLGTAAIFTAFAFLRGNPVELAENSLRYLWNALTTSAADVGYLGMLDYGASARYEFSEVMLAKWGVIILSAFFAALLSFSVARRSNTPVYLLTVVPPVAVILYFELINGNLGFILVAASIAGFISMRMVDSRYGGGAEKRQQRRREREARRRARRKKREKAAIERLKVKTAASRIYDLAISVGMSESRAKDASSAVKYLGKDELCVARIRARKAEREAARAAKAAALEEKKASRENAKLERQREKEYRAGLNKYETFRLKNEKKAEKRKLRRRKLEEKRRTRCNHAAGGYAASAAAIIAVAAMILPFIFLKTPFPKIPFLKTGLDAITSFATDLFVGDGVDLTVDPYGATEKFKYETIDFSPRTYRGSTIFHVEAPSQKTVYLKSRTALDFNIQNDTWSYAEDDDVVEFARKFGKDFTPDLITSNAYYYLLPASSNIPTSHGTLNYERYGFSVEQVRVKRIAGASGILFMPYLANMEHGVLEYDSKDQSSKKVSSFFDGIYTSRYFKRGEDGYSALSYVYNMTRRDLGKAFESVDSEISYAYSLAMRVKEGEDEDAVLEEYYNDAYDSGRVSGLVERYFTTMTKSEKNGFLAYVQTELKYRDYASSTYVRPSGSQRIKALSDSIMESAAPEDGGISRGDMVMAVIDYLTHGYEYSLEPTVPEGEGSAVEKFLFDTKCGYCSHFATSACLLLRDAGIPARYAEGYHVSRLYSAGGDSVDLYASNVLDSDSHTWIEVYFDSVGWVPFETTVTFTEYTEASTDPVGELEPDPWENREERDRDKNNEKNDGKDENPDTPEGGDNAPSFWDRFGTFFITTIVVVSSAALVSLTVLFIKKRARKALVVRAMKIRAIKSGKRYDLGFADRHEDARYLIDSAFTILDAADLRPAKGEQLSEFASRLETEYKGITKQDIFEVMRCVLKEEYGHGLTQEEMVTLASFLEDVIFAVYLGMTKFERIKYRYILRII